MEPRSRRFPVRAADGASHAARWWSTTSVRADFIKGPSESELAQAGVKLRRALPVGNPLIRMINGRIDLRNHRKLAALDNHADSLRQPELRRSGLLPKAKFAPWVDAVMRFEGPIVCQNQHLFAVGLDGQWR